MCWRGGHAAAGSTTASSWAGPLARIGGRNREASIQIPTNTLLAAAVCLTPCDPQTRTKKAARVVQSLSASPPGDRAGP